MSRSTRRPFAAVTGTSSAKADKRLAHRGQRRSQNRSLKTCIDLENLLLPHPLECTWNNNWVWGRDGSQCDYSYLRNSAEERDRRWYRKLTRK
jgi:hypothetical protein